MIPIRWSTLLWLLVYLLVVLAPLIGGVFNLDHGRGFALNFSIALGFVALSMFAAQCVMVSRIRWVSEPVGTDSIYGLHHYLAYVAFAFALLHPAILFAKDPKYWALLNPFTAPLRAQWAWAAMTALIALVVLSVWREPLVKKYHLWKWTHAVLALVVLGGSMTHAVMVNYYLRDRWQQLAWLVLSLMFVVVAFWVRVALPILRLHRRWRVTAITAGCANTHRLDIELVNPDSYGKHGFRFKPGQFAWLTAKRSPFSLTSNPFSICSSAEKNSRVSFIIKTQTGITTELPAIQPGDIVYLDGPHGSFHWHNQTSDAPAVFVAAGVGITPMLSMLESLADRRSTGHCTLWLANRDADNLIGQDQLAQLQSRLPLTVVHLLSQATPHTLPASTAHTRYRAGRMDARVLAELLQLLPAGSQAASTFYLCGPNPFMKTVNAGLLAAGISRAHVHYEKFAMA